MMRQDRSFVETTESAGPIIVLNGPSSAGKTSLARALLETLDPPWAHISIDQFEGMARQRFRLPGAQHFYDECLIPVMHYSAAKFADASVGVILDTLITRPEWLRDAARQLGDYRVYLVGVHCDLHELRRREKERGDRGTGRAEAQVPIVHRLVQSYGGYDLDVDTSQTTPHDCARVLKQFLDAGAVPTALSRIRQALDSAPAQDAAL